MAKTKHTKELQLSDFVAAPDVLAEAQRYVARAAVTESNLYRLPGPTARDFALAADELTADADAALTLLLGDRRWEMPVGAHDNHYRNATIDLADAIGEAQRATPVGAVGVACRKEILRCASAVYSAAAVAADNAETAGKGIVGYADGWRTGDGGYANGQRAGDSAEVLRCTIKHKTLGAAQRCGKRRVALVDRVVCVYEVRADGALGAVAAVC